MTRFNLPSIGRCFPSVLSFFILIALVAGAHTRIFAQSACFTAWSASVAYTGGQTASYGGENYTANWWTQGQNPSTNSGGSGSGQP